MRHSSLSQNPKTDTCCLHWFLGGAPVTPASVRSYLLSACSLPPSSSAVKERIQGMRWLPSIRDLKTFSFPPHVKCGFQSLPLLTCLIFDSFKLFVLNGLLEPAIFSPGYMESALFHLLLPDPHSWGPQGRTVELGRSMSAEVPVRTMGRKGKDQDCSWR